MKALNYFKKHILVILSIVILSLLTAAVIVAFTNPLFIADPVALNDYEIYTKTALDYSYTGILDFSNKLLSYQGKEYLISTVITLDARVISTLKAIIALVIILFVLHGVTLFSLLSKRGYLVALSSQILTLIALIVLCNVSLVNFQISKLIIETTDAFVTITILHSIATFVSLVQVFFDIFLKKAKA